MNSCILMAEIIQDPQLRYTPETQVPIAEMLVQFKGITSQDKSETLKVVGWGNLAQEIHQNYHQGNQVIIEGRLNINTVDHPEGFKEKRAELVAQRIYGIQGELQTTTPITNVSNNPTNPVNNSPTVSSSNVVPLVTGNRAPSSTEGSHSSEISQNSPPTSDEPIDEDSIPF